MQIKRKLWCAEEDSHLQAIITPLSQVTNWNTIAAKFSALGYDKTAQQCKARWEKHLSPDLNTQKWTEAENKELLRLTQAHRGRWKVIASEFQGRNDNNVKNQFYIIVRNSLRSMNKLLGLIYGTTQISGIKPKVMTKLMLGELGVQNDDGLIEKFAFESFSSLTQKIDKNGKKIIKRFIDNLLDVNNQYSEKKKRISKSNAKTNTVDKSTDSQTITSFNNSSMVNDYQKNNTAQNLSKYHHLKLKIQNKLIHLRKLNSQIITDNYTNLANKKTDLLEFFSTVNDVASTIRSELSGQKTDNSWLINDSTSIASSFTKKAENHPRNTKTYIKDLYISDHLNPIQNSRVIGSNNQVTSININKNSNCLEEIDSKNRKTTLSTCLLSGGGHDSVSRYSLDFENLDLNFFTENDTIKEHQYSCNMFMEMIDELNDSNPYF